MRTGRGSTPRASFVDSNKGCRSISLMPYTILSFRFALLRIIILLAAHIHVQDMRITAAELGKRIKYNRSYSYTK